MNTAWHQENPLNCPIVVSLAMMGGKWKPAILHMLALRTMRFGELKKNIPPISQKMLTQQLRELELDGIVVRTVFPEVPPRVEYSLSALGTTLTPLLDALYQWGKAYVDAVGRDHGVRPILIE